MFHYSNANNCTTWKDSRLQKFKDAITKIGFTNEQSKAGIKEWKDAIDLASWIDTDNKRAIEKNLLMAEMSRLWIPWNGADAFARNLDKYNQNNGPSLRNNFLTNSVVGVFENIAGEWERFDTNVLQDFKDKRAKNQTIESLSIQSLWETKQENDRKGEIAKNIAEIYAAQVPFTQLSENSVDNLRARILKMHNNLNASIKILEETAKISIKVCNDQDSGNWNCNPK